MVEVPQEDFRLQNFKKLNDELKYKVSKPDPKYER